MPWSCSSIQDPSHIDYVCWKCLAGTYEGMVLFYAMEPISNYESERQLLFRLFGTAYSRSPSKHCRIMCGTFVRSNHRESDVVRVDNFVPLNDITYLLEQKYPHRSLRWGQSFLWLCNGTKLTWSSTWLSRKLPRWNTGLEPSWCRYQPRQRC